MRTGLLIVSVLIAASVSAQNVGIGADSFTPDASAILELRSNNSGLLMPRLTQSQRNSISSPAEGLLMYQTDNTPGFYYYDGSAWETFGSGSADDFGDHTAEENIHLNGNWLSGDGDEEGVFVSDNGNVGVMVGNPTAAFHTGGTVRHEVLAGAGNRMVVADAQGNLTTQPIPTASGFGTGTTIDLHLTNDIINQDVSGVSVIRLSSSNSNNEIKGLTGGVAGQIICLVNTDSSHKVKFKKDQGTQQFRDDLTVEKKEGGIIMFDGVHWYILSKH